MTEIIPVKTPAKRRRFSNAFKTRIVAACDQPGASVAGVALAHGVELREIMSQKLEIFALNINPFLLRTRYF